MNQDIEWKDEKLEIDKDVKINYANDKSITISNLAEDISTQLTSIDTKLDQVLYLLQVPSDGDGSASLIIQNQTEYYNNFIRLYFTNGKIDVENPIKGQSRGARPFIYNKVCKVFSYRNTDRSGIISFSATVRVGIRGQYYYTGKYVKFYIKGGNSSDYIELPIKKTIDYTSGGGMPSPWGYFVASDVEFGKDSIQIVNDDYYLYVVYHIDFNPGEDTNSDISSWDLVFAESDGQTSFVTDTSKTFLVSRSFKFSFA